MRYIVERRTRGFTLIELLVILVVLAVLAVIVLPKFASSGWRSKEAAVKSDLKLLRDAVDRFYADTGVWPLNLNQLALTTAPATGIDSSGNPAVINPSDWHGPYVDSVPKDALANAEYSYKITSPSVGTVRSSATGTGSDGTSPGNW